MSTPPATLGHASTLGQLRASGWRSLPVKHELRGNAAARIAAGLPIVEGILGFDDTVLPQLENALLAGHDVVFLGERGQAKTRIIRSLTGLLDEWMPVVAGSEINDDPYVPVSRHGRDLVRERGDDTPIEWVHRSDRFGEKLATPDTSIADLIGEVDPIKVAEGRYLSDELTLHYGLVPRTNRGIFAINELPDLAERIQVGLLNVLEERDVQVRGYKIRLPLDLMLVASANPEDYTSRGRLITPLKDRFGAQIRTHYPVDTDTELAVVAQEARPAEVDGIRVAVPAHMARIVAGITHGARRSPHVNQRSGVSVRLSIANYETLVANATRRASPAGRVRGGAAHQRPGGDPGVDGRQGRGGDPGRGRRRSRAGPAGQGRGAGGVQGELPGRAPSGVAGVVRLRHGVPRRRRRARRCLRRGHPGPAGAAQRGHAADRQRDAGRGGQRRRARAGGAAPVPPPEQGSGGGRATYRGR